jgi:hypothetical protein
MESPEIREIINEIPHLSKLLNAGTMQYSQEKSEAERVFLEKYGTKYGTLDEFISRHGTASSSELPNNDPCTFYDPSEKRQCFDPVTKKQYSPRILPSSKKTGYEFNIFEFLSTNFERGEEIVVEFLDYEPNEEEEFISSSFLDICLQEMGKLVLILNESKELGYRIMEIQTEKPINH